MKINILKALVIAACFFIIPLCSNIKSTDVLEAGISNEIKNNCKKHLDGLQNDKLEDPKSSWAAYFLPPAKIIIQRTFEIMRFAANNPQACLIIELFLANQVVAANTNNCQYYTALHSETVRVWGVNCDQQEWKFFFSRPVPSDSLRFGEWGHNCDQKVGCFWTPSGNYFHEAS
jgi:hypothetical protein